MNTIRLTLLVLVTLLIGSCGKKDNDSPDDGIVFTDQEINQELNDLDFLRQVFKEVTLICDSKLELKRPGSSPFVKEQSLKLWNILEENITKKEVSFEDHYFNIELAMTLDLELKINRYNLEKNIPSKYNITLFGDRDLKVIEFSGIENCGYNRDGNLDTSHSTNSNYEEIHIGGSKESSKSKWGPVDNQHDCTKYRDLGWYSSLEIQCYVETVEN